MVVYNFKKMTTVPTATDFLDIVLSQTQRKTPTVVHPGYNIVRIRQFYMRKVKYMQNTCHEKLTLTLTDFPRLEDIHPFYADLINVLYDRDHYKLALGQLNIARQLIDRVGKDYVKLLKYGDSLYRCKALKRAALGRMCTVLKRQKGALEYLEQVRQHLMRLPSIDPTTRTIIVAGYPNVGKSSFMNKVTRANVDVQPYAFTTKSLYVGHMDYKYMRWQVLDTPGVLDKPLEERNTIEMQSITALAHLQATVLYVVDLSEQCGYSIAQQVALFAQIKPLFLNKPLVVAVNKVDARPAEELTDNELTELQKLKDAGATLHYMSALADIGVSEVKSACCDLLLAQRVEHKLAGKKVESVINRIRVAQPKAPDGSAAAATRPTSIPQSVLAARAARASRAAAGASSSSKGAGSSTDLPGADDDDEMTAPKRMTQRELQEEHGGAGVYSRPLQEHWELSKPEWANDMIPEIMDGKNIADFVDPDIERRLEELEAEEEQRVELAKLEKEQEGVEMDDEEAAQVSRLAERIRRKKGLLQASAKTRRAANHPTMKRSTKGGERSVEAFVQHMGGMGVTTDADHLPNLSKARARGRSREPAPRGRSLERRGAGGDADAMDVEGGGAPAAKKVRRDSITRDKSALRRDAAAAARSRSPSRVGLKDESALKKAEKLAKKKQFKMNKMGKASESDRRIAIKKPRHLFSGKRGNGKTDRR